MKDKSPRAGIAVIDQIVIESRYYTRRALKKHLLDKGYCKQKNEESNFKAVHRVKHDLATTLHVLT